MYFIGKIFLQLHWLFFTKSTTLGEWLLFRIDRRTMSRGLKRKAAALNKYESTELRIGVKLWTVPLGARLHGNSRGSDRVASIHGTSSYDQIYLYLGARCLVLPFRSLTFVTAK